jgi:hypothetical protein
MLNRWRARRTLERLCHGWVEYREVVRRAAQSGAADPAQEELCLVLEAQIAAATQTLIGQLPEVGEEVHQGLVSLTDFLKHHRGLAVVGASDTCQIEAFESDWHERYIFLSQLKGARLHAPAPKRGAGVMPPLPSGPGHSPRWRVRRAPWGARLLRFAVQAGLFALVVHLAGRALGLRWAASGQFIPQTPDSLGAALGNLTGAFATFWTSLLSPLQPVLDSYGSLTGGLLLGVLALGLLYWAFIRH